MRKLARMIKFIEEERSKVCLLGHKSSKRGEEQLECSGIAEAYHETQSNFQSCSPFDSGEDFNMFQEIF